jgi:hypothetical protein
MRPGHASVRAHMRLRSSGIIASKEAREVSARAKAHARGTIATRARGPGSLQRMVSRPFLLRLK